MEFVTTTSTGVGVGSAGDCERAGSDVKERNKATQKNFVYIVDRAGDLLQLKGDVIRAALGRVGKDSLIDKKVVKLKTFIYVNHKD